MKTKITKIKLVLSVLFTVGFIVNGIFITIYNVDKSSNIGIISQDIEKLKSENNKLIGNISQIDSLTSFVNRSESLGFISSGLHLYFDKKDTVAQVR